MAIGIGHDHPADRALADVDASRPERDETVDFRSLITLDGGRDVEMQPVLPGLRHQRRTAPGDLRSAAWRANRGLLVLIPDQRPRQRFTPEIPDLLRTVARKRSDESAVGEEAVVRLNDAELIAFGVCEHNMALLPALTDVDASGPESERPRYRLLLGLEGRARQIEVQLVLAGLRFLSWKELDPDPGVIARQQPEAALGVADQLPPQDARPEAREPERVVRIETERDEVASHSAPYLPSGGSQPHGTCSGPIRLAPAVHGRPATSAQLSGSSANAFFVRLYQPIPLTGCFQRPFMSLRAPSCAASPPATAALRCASWALMTSSAVAPSRARSHGPPSCLQVIVFTVVVPFDVEG